jgi:lipopolysaccharide/colanic/teichoic acid biosynthesis glycosyltransferase/glycosyltransferase involved in cell wall biosynthesis
MKKKVKLLRVTTVPISLKILLAGQLDYFKSHKKYDVLAVSADGPEVVQQMIGGVNHQVVPMTRKITPIQDLICLLQLVVIIRDFQPDIIHTHTPKAGLLGMLAGWITRVPVRMHTVAGLPLMEKTGLLKKLLIAIEKLTYACATHVFPNSRGLKDFITHHISKSKKVRVLGHGSSNGIDTQYFRRRDAKMTEAEAIRRKYNIKPGDVVFCFVGRVVKDKGISELVHAFEICRDRLPPDRKFFLLVVGPLEQDLDPIEKNDLEFLTEDEHVILAGYQIDVRPWIMAADVFVFPSYREGFPNVVMQACCLEVPCIVTDINGCNEIIRHNETGLVVPPKDPEALAHAMITMTREPAMRKQMALAARHFVTANYDQRYVWDMLHKEYETAGTLSKIRASEKFSWYRRIIKPTLDVVVAALALIILSPVILICMGVLAWANKGRIWFTQLRPGKNGKLFRVIKFKTMTDERDAHGMLLPDDKRLTKVGSFIRRTSLDELPQLLNVVRGDMSFVGPRPLLEEYMPLYNDEQRKRHAVRPGITGWAQINGRNAISWDQKFAFDVWYVKHQSFVLDIKIIFMTIAKVFKAEGISSETSATMEKWKGNEIVINGERNHPKVDDRVREIREAISDN